MIIYRTFRKFRDILSHHQKMRIAELTVLMVVGGFMEMLSVSLILPFMNAVMQPEQIMGNRYVKMVCEWVDINSYRSFLVFLALVMAVVYTIKNCFLVFHMTVQNRFVYNNMFDTQQRLLHNYLMRPYEYYLDVKSGDVLRVIKEDTSNAFTSLTTLLQLFTELIVSGVLIITAFFITPLVTIAMAVLLLFMLCIIMGVIRPTLRRAGEKNRVVGASMNQWLLQSIQGIKEVKIMGKEEYFEKSYEVNGKKYVRTTYIGLTLGMMPRFLIEAVSLSAFFVTVAIMIYRGMEMQEIIPLISAVGMAAIRLLPSVNRISQAIATIAFSEPALDKLIENLNEASDYERLKKRLAVKEEKDTVQMLEKEIALDDITYKYPSGMEPVLKCANLKIKKGESIGIVGASGAGKTTIVDILLGLLNPDSGEVLVDGRNIRADMRGWLDQVGYIPQDIFMLDGDIIENIAFGLSSEKVDEDDIWTALKEASIDRDIRNMPDGLRTQLGERGVRLSGGQRQRIGIARALYSNPQVLFFDEATSALDNATESEIMESINHLHGAKTIIIIAHRLSTIESCDHVFRVQDGKIVQER